MAGLSSKTLIFLGLFCLVLSMSLVWSLPTNDLTLIKNDLNLQKYNLTRRKRMTNIDIIKFPVDSADPRFQEDTDEMVMYQVRNYVGSQIRVICKETSNNYVMTPETINYLQVMGFSCAAHEAPYNELACEAVFTERSFRRNRRKAYSFILFGEDAVGSNNIISIFADRISMNTAIKIRSSTMYPNINVYNRPVVE